MASLVCKDCGQERETSVHVHCLECGGYLVKPDPTPTMLQRAGDRLASALMFLVLFAAAAAWIYFLATTGGGNPFSGK